VRSIVSVAVLAAVIATALVSVRLHRENARLRYRLADLGREGRRLEREHRLAAAELERARAPSALLRLRDLRREEARSVATAPREEGP
jgi:hypothetical protein